MDNLIKNLRQTNSITIKRQLINKFNSIQKMALIYAYDYNNCYNLKFKINPEDKIGASSGDMLVILDKILHKFCVGHKAKEMVEEFAEKNGELIKYIINGDLKCGISTKIINSVHPNLIPTFEIGKADTCDIDKLQYPVLCQLKYDGARLVIIRRTKDDIEFRSSKGLKANFPDLYEAIKNTEFYGVLDGEIIWDKGLQKDRKIICGKLTSAIKGKNKVDESKMVFKAFDSLDINSWDSKISYFPYTSRYDVLARTIELISNDKIQLAESIQVDSYYEVEKLYSAYIKKGFEGVILKKPGSYYNFKRSKDWIKIKEVKDCDLTCIGINPGEGKYKGLVGSLICAGTVEGKEVEVCVGSGLSSTDVTRDDFEGQTIEVKYNDVIRNSKDNGWTLFLPRYSRIRKDK